MQMKCFPNHGTTFSQYKLVSFVFLFILNLDWLKPIKLRHVEVGVLACVCVLSFLKTIGCFESKFLRELMVIGRPMIDLMH